MRIIAKLKKLLGMLFSLFRTLLRGVKGSGLGFYFKRLNWLINYVENEHGGQNSLIQRQSVDNANRPLPWITYPAIEFLKQLDFSDAIVFEYGSGNSSQFWAKRCREIISIESKLEWYEYVAQQKLPNQTLLLKSERKEYIESIHLADRSFDVIVVDGSYRYECARNALMRISADGLIILDNADWHPETVKLLTSNGLLQVDFIGMTPLNNYGSCTSFFFQRSCTLPRRQRDQAIEVIGGMVQRSSSDAPIDQGAATDNGN